MDYFIALLIIAACIAVLYLLIKLLTKPIKLAFKLLLNTVLGFAAFLGCNFLLSFLAGKVIMITLTKLLVVGVLGIPGFILVLLFEFL